MTQSNVIGLTGTTGSGKTTCSHIMQSLGAHVINADIVAREVLLPESDACKEIRAELGDDVMLSGTDVVDRKKLAKRIFSDADARRVLDSIMLPRIKALMYKKAEVISIIHKNSLIVFDAPLLIEAGLGDNLRDIWLIRATDEVRIERIMQRDGISREDAEARLRARVSDDELAKYATVIVDNNGGYATLTEKIAKIFAERYGIQ